MVDLLTDPTQAAPEGDPCAWGVGGPPHRALARRAGAGAPRGHGEWLSNDWRLQGDAGLAYLASACAGIGTPSRWQRRRAAVQLRPTRWRAWLAAIPAQASKAQAGILADDMGLNQKPQALAMCWLKKGRAVAVAPAPGGAAHLAALQLAGQGCALAPDDDAGTAWLPTVPNAYRTLDHDLVLTTYPLLGAMWRRWPRSPLILDEAQMVKNAGSRSAALPAPLQAPTCCADGHAASKENHLGELWAQFDFDARLSGRCAQLQRPLAQTIEENSETLRARCCHARAPFICDAANGTWPPSCHRARNHPARAAAGQAAQAVQTRTTADKQVRRALGARALKARKSAILDALLKLRQVCCDPQIRQKHPKTAHTMERAKLELLADLLPALVVKGRRVLVFSQFTEMLALTAEMLDTWSALLTLTGQTPPASVGPW